MQEALDLFRANMRRSRDLVELSRVITAQTTDALDLSDVLRASLVMSVSALDHFIHDIVRVGMLDAYRAERDRTPAFLRFEVTIDSVLQGTSSFVQSEEWLENQIRGRQSHLSFQMPDRIAEAIRLISSVELWNEISRELKITQREVRDTISLIVQRRNKIAHEADTIPDYARQVVHSDLRSPIDEKLVDDAIRFIEGVAGAIYSLVSTRESSFT